MKEECHHNANSKILDGPPCLPMIVTYEILSWNHHQGWEEEADKADGVTLGCRIDGALILVY
jgi:hypothetical protein